MRDARRAAAAQRYATLWAAYDRVFGDAPDLAGLRVLDVGAANGAASLLSLPPAPESLARAATSFRHFEGLSLGPVLLESAETFTDPCSAHGSLREFLKNPEDGCIQDMLK